MRRLKVLFLTPWYPTEDNPMGGVFVQEHAKAVQFLDDVVVFHSVGVPHLSKSLPAWQQEGNPHITKNIPTYRVRYQQSSIPLVSLWYRFRHHWLALRRLTKQGFYPDLIHAHIYSAGFIGVLLGKFFRVPVLVTEQSSGFARKMLSKRGILEAKLTFEHADLVVPVSCALKRDIEAYGIQGQFHCIPNVVDDTLFYPTSNSSDNSTTNFLSVGSQVPVKRIDLLLRAFAEVNQATSSWRLDVIGDGSERRNYEQLATELALREQVYWHGLLPKSAIADQMRRANCLIVSSSHETFSAVAVESLSCGTPVLATRCGGPTEFITEKNGLLVERDNVHALTQGILWMINQVSQFDREQIAKEAYKQFSLKAVGLQLDTLYRQVISSQ